MADFETFADDQLKNKSFEEFADKQVKSAPSFEDFADSALKRSKYGKSEYPGGSVVGDVLGGAATDLWQKGLKPIVGLGEAGLNAVSGIGAGMIGLAGGALKGLSQIGPDIAESAYSGVPLMEGGKTAQVAEKAMSDISAPLTYQPKTQEGANFAQVFNSPFEVSAAGVDKFAKFVSKDAETQAAIRVSGNLAVNAFLFKNMAKIAKGEPVFGKEFKAEIPQDTPPEIRQMVESIPDNAPVSVKGGKVVIEPPQTVSTVPSDTVESGISASGTGDLAQPPTALPTPSNVPETARPIVDLTRKITRKITTPAVEPIASLGEVGVPENTARLGRTSTEIKGGGILDKTLLKTREDLGVIQSVTDDFLSKMGKDGALDERDAIDRRRQGTNLGAVMGDWLRASAEKLFKGKEAPKIMDMWYTYYTNPDYFARKFPGVKPADVFTPAQLDFAQTLKIASDQRFDALTRSGTGIDMEYVQNHLPQIILDKEGNRHRNLNEQTLRPIQQESRFWQERQFPDEEAVDKSDAGYKIDKNIPRILSLEIKNQMTALANRRFFEDAKQATDTVKSKSGGALRVPAFIPENSSIVKNSPEMFKDWQRLAQEPFRSMFEDKIAKETKTDPNPMAEKAGAVLVSPKWAREMKNALASNKEPSSGILSGVYQKYLQGRSAAKRVIMLNPGIHSANLFSGAIVEEGPHIFKATAEAMRNLKDPKYLARAYGDGLEYMSRRRPMTELSEGLSKAVDGELEKTDPSGSVFKKIGRTIGKVKEFNDRLVFEKMGTLTQTVVYESLRDKFLKKGLPEREAGKAAANMANNVAGSLPYYWYSKASREMGSIVFFARNWTTSNFNELMTAVNPDWSFAKRGFTPETKQIMSNQYKWYLAKGVTYLLLTNSLLSTSLTGINTGKWTPVMPWNNVDWKDPKSFIHFFEVDTGAKDKKGNKVFLTTPFFKFIKDILRIPLDTVQGKPQKFLFDKMEPLLKQGLEQLIPPGGLHLWNGQPIVKPGMTTGQGFMERLKNLGNMTPIRGLSGGGNQSKAEQILGMGGVNFSHYYPPSNKPQKPYKPKK